MAAPRKINAAELLRIEGEPSRKLYTYSIVTPRFVDRPRPLSFTDRMRGRSPQYDRVIEERIDYLGRYRKRVRNEDIYEDEVGLKFEKQYVLLKSSEDAPKVLIVHEESRGEGAGDPGLPGGSRLNKKTRRSKGRRRNSVGRKLRKLTSRRR
jgi:hypothetical protein